MDVDLILAVALMAVLSLAALLAGRALAARLGFGRTPLFALLVLLTSFYASWWVGRIENALLLPLGPVILLSNFTPVLACFLAGFALQMPGADSPRRSVVLSIMVALGGVFLLAPLLRPVLMPIQLHGSGQWIDGLCIQTDDATCGPAAAATLLRYHGIEVNEREMAVDCLTSGAGTEPLALYRALLKRTRGVGLVPRLASGRPEQWTTFDQFPVLAVVAPSDRQFRSAPQAGRLHRLLGRTSEAHAVVILGRDRNGDYLVGDPASGHATWDPYVMSRFFSGQAIYLQRQSE